MTKRIELRLFKALGVTKDSDVKMIDYFFEHGDGFKGVTGSSFYFVGPEDISERNDLENIKDGYEFIWRETVAAGKTEESLDDWMDSFRDEYLRNSDSLFVGHDTSYIHYLDRDEAFLSFFNSLHGLDLEGCYDDEKGTFECVGGGRCFSGDEADLEHYLDDNTAILHDLIRAFESGNIEIDLVETVLKDLSIPFERIEK